MASHRVSVLIAQRFNILTSGHFSSQLQSVSCVEDLRGDLYFDVFVLALQGRRKGV